MRPKNLLVLFLTLMTGVSCQDVYDKKILSQSLDVIVVEGVITSENINHKIHLSLPYENQNGTAEAVSGAIISLTSSDNSYSLTEVPAGSGDYYTPQFSAVTNKTYTLTIQVGNKIFTAQDTPPAVEPLGEFDYFVENNLYALSLSESGNSPNYIQYHLDWTATPVCTGDCVGEVYYYDLKSTDVNEIFKADETDFDFPAGTTVIRRKYSVSAEYRNFLRSMLSETEWHGGIFDVQPASVSTNLSDGAIGFFAVSTVAVDTVMVVKR